jgi:23S rRNA pseudouridine955/2504/2580 synthase
MNDLSKARASWLEVGEESAAQRIDNFLLRRLKGVPKSHVYRVLRSGEVRVNSGRVRPEYRLQVGDRIRVPPIRIAPRPALARPSQFPIVFEDAALLVIDKPPGVARPHAKLLELAHRLDRDTSGLLIVAKKRSALVELHRLLREAAVEKVYVAVVKGAFKKPLEIREPLHKYVSATGERRVSVGAGGRRAVTRVKPLKANDHYSVLEVRLLTGRTHQIRVHLAHAGHPVLGDDKYGDFPLNHAVAKLGVRRLFLHARRLRFAHPVTGEGISLESKLPEDMQEFIDKRLA